MKLELDKQDLKSLVKGSTPSYNMFDNTLVLKAGHHYNDQYGRTSWYNLDNLNEEELWELYNLCKKSWAK